MERINLNKLGHDLQTLMSDAEELLRATAGNPGEKISAVRARAEESLRSVRDRLSAAELEVANQARSADHYVHENPWRSMALAGGVAFLTGLLIGRR